MVSCLDIYCTGLAAAVESEMAMAGRGFALDAVDAGWDFDVLSEEQMEQLLRRLVPVCTSKTAVVLCLHSHQALRVLEAAARLDVLDNVVWIGSESASSLPAGT